MPSNSKVADILHKTVTGSLALITAFALVDVTRGFSVLVKRNIDRRDANALVMDQQQDRRDVDSKD
ncbi:hypothetical protein Plhal304r1_c003g0012531 [Plasmopara halstedii]